MSEVDETNLIARAQDGDVRAFEALYRLHSPRVHGLCVRLADSLADAEDATQETFIRAWNSLTAFRGDSAFSTWLHRIAFNAVVSRKRRDSAESRHLGLADPEAVAADAADPGAPVEIERIERALGRLPERARQALVLHRIYGYTHDETAAFMGIAAGTCKAQVHRALRLLRTALGEPDDAADDATAWPVASTSSAARGGQSDD